MKELISFLTDWGDISFGMILALIPFSVIVALFHSVILQAMYGWEYKPNWLFTVLEPALVCLLGVIKPSLGMFAFVTFAVLTFVLAIAGFTIMPLVMKLKETKVEYRRTGKKFTAFTAGKLTGGYVLGIIAVPVIMLILGTSLPLIFLLLFIYPPPFRSEESRRRPSFYSPAGNTAHLSYTFRGYGACRGGRKGRDERKPVGSYR